MYDVLEAETVQIICGAQNVREGMKVPVATLGTRLTLRVPNPKPVEADANASIEKVLKIKKSKLRGEVSHGMICSEEELGLVASSNGVMELRPESLVGTPISEYLEQNDKQHGTVILDPQ
jgi:phenylalanyl-tRNA synthetase beta chain